MSVDNEYDEAKSIARRVEAEGFYREAADIRNAVDSGASGNEIFMQLRFHLKRLIDCLEIDHLTRRNIETLLKRIEEKLNS